MLTELIDNHELVQQWLLTTQHGRFAAGLAE